MLGWSSIQIDRLTCLSNFAYSVPPAVELIDPRFFL